MSHRRTDPATTSRRGLKEELVDCVGYLTALAKIDLRGDLNYSERNIVEKLTFETTKRWRIGRQLKHSNKKAQSSSARVSEFQRCI